MTCRFELEFNGKPYPRTCPTCGFVGKCVNGYEQIKKEGGGYTILAPQQPEPASNVTKLELVEVGEGFRFDPDDLLEKAKGQAFEKVVILGALPGGELWVSGSANAGESLILIEKAKHHIVFGDD